MRRNKIFKATVRGRQFYIKAVDMCAAATFLTQFGLGHKDLCPAPGHSKKAMRVAELANVIRNAKYNKGK